MQFFEEGVMSSDHSSDCATLLRVQLGSKGQVHPRFVPFCDAMAHFEVPKNARGALPDASSPQSIPVAFMLGK